MNQDELSADTASLRAKVVELQELKAKYESMVEAFDGQIYICSSDYRVEFMNRRLIERTGRDAVGEVCYKAIHELESICPWCVNERVFRGETVRWEVLSPKDHRWYYIVNTPIHHPDGSMSKMAMTQDITERKQAEERLRLLDFALDHVREAAFLTDEDARFRFVNEESCSVLGYTRSELLGLGVSDIDPDFPPDRWFNHWEDLKAKRSLMFEGRHKTKDGRIFPVEINANYFEYGGQDYNLALVRDITDRKQEENVRLARLRLMKFADTHTLEELLQATLDEAEALTGSLIGFYHFVDSDQRSLWLQSWSTRTLREMCTAEGKGLHYDVSEAGVWVDCVHQRKPVIHNDYSALTHRKGMPVGHAKVTRELVVPVFRSDRIVAILGVGNKPVEYVQSDVEIVSLLADLAWDIAERKLAEEKLRRSEAKFLDLYENAPCAYLSVGTDAIIRLCNQRCGEFLGYSREELIGKPVLELYADQPGGKEKAAHIFKRFLAGEPIADEELRMQKADGSPLWISLTVNGVRDSDGHLVESRSMVLDISERKQAEEAHRRLTRELRAISDCNQTLLRAVDEQPLVNDICRIICTEAGYRLAWVGYAENDDAKTIRPVAWAGVEEGYFADALLTWADTERGHDPFGITIREGISSCVQDFTTDPRAMPWREKAIERGCRSCIALPLRDESENTFGILCIYSTEPNAFTPEEIRLLEELAGDLAFGLVVLRTRGERDLAEEALRESEKKVRRKLDAVLSPETDIAALELSDIIDSERIQKLMDEFYRLAKVGIGIIDLHGKVLVGTGWQDICTKFHRANPESCRLCIESDLELSRNVPVGTFKQYRCKHNMWDIATPIMLGDNHVGNIFLGQFLFDDEISDYEVFRHQARKYGFKEQEYIEALDRVPRWSRERVEAAMSFYAAFASMIGNLSYSNIKLANALEERKRVEETLREREEFLTLIVENIPNMICNFSIRAGISWQDQSIG